MSMMAMATFLFLWVSICMIVQIQGAYLPALVTHLPGFTGILPSKHYSGYIKLGLELGERKNLFYYFVESERDPVKDPLILWLNGGPGCSSMDGFIYEHGPFNFEAPKVSGELPKLHPNPYSWSKVANVIYLDSPAGVGLSFAHNTSLYKTGDFQTAKDTHIFIQQWLKKFPEFVSNPFYLAGESYAGVYVPTLASNIVKGIKAGIKPVINFKGYLLGNPITDNSYDGNALVPFAHGMGLISDEIHQRAVDSCNGSYFDSEVPKCVSALDRVFRAIDKVNLYDILEPCYHNKASFGAQSMVPDTFKELGMQTRTLPVRTRLFGRAWPFMAPVLEGLVLSWPQVLSDAKTSTPPCVSDEVASAWLNNAHVRRAIHAAPQIYIGAWELCTNRLEYWHDAGSALMYHKKLTSEGYRALIYSGDHDMCVPFTGTEAWTRSINNKIVDEWRPWMSSTGQVAGFLQGYANNLTFLTIKGAGHTVPEYKPREAFDFVKRWLEGKRI
ncbi:serine carboxypeptidase-like 20 [Mercurialis annua]|uniref:serine carboxypeptidase-like 20 n=1 Tax=Mercurialis annua TaxID=3986 RepID=UPI00215E8B90|nr:serine carboxypeptidase-like 20 [Mercurialis annua]